MDGLTLQVLRSTIEVVIFPPVNNSFVLHCMGGISPLCHPRCIFALAPLLAFG
jgi:hypothetical protein